MIFWRRTIEHTSLTMPSQLSYGHQTECIGAILCISESSFAWHVFVQMEIVSLSNRRMYVWIDIGACSRSHKPSFFVLFVVFACIILIIYELLFTRNSLERHGCYTTKQNSTIYFLGCISFWWVSAQRRDSIALAIHIRLLELLLRTWTRWYFPLILYVVEEVFPRQTLIEISISYWLKDKKL